MSSDQDIGVSVPARSSTSQFVAEAAAASVQDVGLRGRQNDAFTLRARRIGD